MINPEQKEIFKIQLTPFLRKVLEAIRKSPVKFSKPEGEIFINVLLENEKRGWVVDEWELLEFDELDYPTLIYTIKQNGKKTFGQLLQEWKPFRMTDDWKAENTQYLNADIDKEAEVYIFPFYVGGDDMDVLESHTSQSEIVYLKKEMQSRSFEPAEEVGCGNLIQFWK